MRSEGTGESLVPVFLSAGTCPVASIRRNLVLGVNRVTLTREWAFIAAGAGVLLLLIFFGYLLWLNNQGPVLARSEERDPLSGIPNSISLNPLRDRASEREAEKFIRAMSDGHCQEELASWEKDYRKKYAAYICDSEAAPGQREAYTELLSVTLENRSGEWAVTKYDAIY